MIQLDDTFLAEVGLSGLPAADKADLLNHVYEELELRVGNAISMGLSERQLEEFGAIVDHDYPTITAWLDETAPDFLQDPAYRRLAEELPEVDPATLVSEYAATKWLQVNRPEYQKVVAAELAEIKVELCMSAPRLLTGIPAATVDHV